jgi:hypothetical protein
MSNFSFNIYNRLIDCHSGGRPESLPPVEPSPSENPPLTTETRLPDIDPVSLSLHKALHHFRPLSSDYASTPYADAFNWHELELPIDEEREWYCVAFVSKRKDGSNGERTCPRCGSLLLSIDATAPQLFTKLIARRMKKLFETEAYVVLIA